MYLCVRLILCLAKYLIVGSPRGLMCSPNMGPLPDCINKYCINIPGMFCPMKQVSNTIRMQLVTPILAMPLQHPGTYFARTIVTVAVKVHSLVGLFMTVLSQCPNSIFQYIESQPALINISGQDQINFFMFYKSSVWCSQQQNKTRYLFKVNKI